MAIAWHYTSGQAGVQIIRAGCILARPVAWFSTRPDIDPSACRTILRGDRPHRLSVGQMHRMFAGWFRFGVPVTELVPAEEVRRRAAIRREAWRMWRADARAQGADVKDWFATFEPVRLERCQVHRLDGHPLGGAWRLIADPRSWASAELDASIVSAWRGLQAGETDGFTVTP